MSQLKPRIYVVCLAAYQSGKQYGKWINANQKASSLKHAIQSFMAKSPAENAKKWAIHDQKDFGAVKLSKHKSLKKVSEIAALIAKYGELGAALVNQFYEVIHAKSTMEEAYYGVYQGEADFAYQHFNKISRDTVREALCTRSRRNLAAFDYMANYIDYERYTSDLFSDDFFALKVQGKTHVFGCI